ncbi:MAG: right-handed parallel beta-helix repeat-containing protein, partial [Chloroflexi bacterium]|nr:right-handed parallel beta-helix repeat-containing protein [Chloroflexota bacterium]
VDDLPNAQIMPNDERGISVIAGAAEIQIVNNYVSAGDFGIVIDGEGTTQVSLTRNVIAGARDGLTEAAIDVRGGVNVNLGGDDDQLGNHVCGATYGIRIAGAEEVTIFSNAVGAGAAMRVTFDSDDAMSWGIRLQDGASRATVRQNHLDEVSSAAISVVGHESQDNNLTRNRYGWNGIDIDLDADGVTENDARDRDRGPNDLLNRPRIDEHVVDRISTGVFKSEFSGVATPGSYVEIYVWRNNDWDPIARSGRVGGRGTWLARTLEVARAPIRALAVTGPGATSEFSDVFLPAQRVRLSAGVVRFAWTGPEMPVGEGLEPIARWVDAVWRWDAALSRWDGWFPKVPSLASTSEFRVRTGDVLHVRLSGRPPRDFFVPAGGTISDPEAIVLRAGFNSVAWLGGRVEAFDVLQRLSDTSPGIIGTLWQWNPEDGGVWEPIWPRLARAWKPGHWEFPVFWLRATRDGTLSQP